MLKKNFISVITAISAIALIGLIAIQVYWIQSAIDQRESQFEDHVRQSMVEVVNNVAKLETYKRVKKSSRTHKALNWLAQQGKQLIDDHVTSTDTLISKVSDKLNIEVLAKNEINPDNGQVSQKKIISQRFGDDAELKIEITDTTPAGLDSREIIGEMWDDKVDVMEDFVADFFSFDFFETVDQRISYEELDSIVKQVLSKNGINTGYSLGVYDMYNQPVYNHNETYSVELLSSQFKMSLFPNDFFGSPVYMSLFFPNEKGFIIRSMWMMLLISAIFVLIIIYAFYYSISTIFKQKKLSIIKNDFINNMTHELKTPISTISLACEALNDNAISQSGETRKRFVNMINDENNRLGVLVENVLQSAVIDRGELELKKEVFDLHEVIDAAVKNVVIQVEKNGGGILVEKNAEHSLIEADKVHITNVIYNLLDNANKYSDGAPNITIQTEDVVGNVVLKVIDKGIGISKENQRKIFEKLYRVPTGDIHNVKGFGLGLSYVMAIIRKHEGSINVDSTLGKGSTFIVHLPNVKKRKDEQEN